MFPGCEMISTIGVHQPPPPTPSAHPRRGAISPMPQMLFKRQLNLQFLDLTDCLSLEDTGLKMIVEACPQLLYLFLRRCTNVTGKSQTVLCAWILIGFFHINTFFSLSCHRWANPLLLLLLLLLLSRTFLGQTNCVCLHVSSVHQPWAFFFLFLPFLYSIFEQPRC